MGEFNEEAGSLRGRHKKTNKPGPRARPYVPRSQALVHQNHPHRTAAVHRASNQTLHRRRRSLCALLLLQLGHVGLLGFQQAPSGGTQFDVFHLALLGGFGGGGADCHSFGWHGADRHFYFGCGGAAGVAPFCCLVSSFGRLLIFVGARDSCCRQG